MSDPKVIVIMGSESDFPAMKAGVDVLDQFGVAHEVIVASAHRTPARVMKIASEAEGRGVQLFIAGAGMAAHLAGVIAAHTVLPILGVPMEGGALNGVDALYSTVQMPGGIPVASLGIGKHGAKNAGYKAVAILALSDAGLREKLHAYRDSLNGAVDGMNERVQAQLGS